MSLLYAIDLTVDSSGGPSATFDLCRNHIGDWLQLGSGSAVLHESGEIEVSGRQDGELVVPARAASWEALGVNENRGLRVIVAQNQERSVEFTTVVSLVQLEDVVSIRVALVREISSTWLSPVGDAQLFQPRVLTAISFDQELVLETESQRVDSRFIPILTKPEATELARQLRIERRLPILLMHARDEASREVARSLPRRLIGLVRVVTLNYSTARILADELRAANVPYGGALLVWPSLTIPGLAFERDEIASLHVDGMRARLMSRLAPVSALARGTDEGWRNLRALAQAQIQRAALDRIEQARSREDSTAELEAQAELIDQLTVTVDEWKALAQDADERATSSEAAAADTQRAEDDARYWRQMYQDLMRTSQGVPTDLWAQVPELVSGSDPHATFVALEQATEGRIAFTDKARRSWAGENYPDPADMTRKLTALARAACSLYDGSDRSMGHLATWFKTEFEINVALTDQTIARSKTLRDFEFEGRTFDQVKHVKVRDGVKPNEVGRIHFALDPTEGRIVVNHVALKLYGI